MKNKSVSASSQWAANHSAEMAFDANQNTRWAGEKGSRKCWLEVDLGKPTDVSVVVVDEMLDRISKYEIQVLDGGKMVTVASGDKLGSRKQINFKSVKTQKVRLNILEASEVPTIVEMEVYTK